MRNRSSTTFRLRALRRGVVNEAQQAAFTLARLCSSSSAFVRVAAEIFHCAQLPLCVPVFPKLQSIPLFALVQFPWRLSLWPPNQKPMLLTVEGWQDEEDVGKRKQAEETKPSHSDTFFCCTSTDMGILNYSCAVVHTHLHIINYRWQPTLNSTQTYSNSNTGGWVCDK